VALNNGGYLHPWDSAQVLVPLILGVLILAGFVIWEMRFAKVPIAPRELFQRRVTRMAFIISFIAGMNFYSLTNFAPTYFSNVYPADPILVGARGAGMPTTTIFGAVFGNWFLSRYPKYARWSIAASCAVMSKSSIIGTPLSITRFADPCLKLPLSDA
jgi:hypothetical protein